MRSSSITKTIVAAGMAVAFNLGSAIAGPVSQTPVETFDPFARGNMELEATAGAFWSVGTTGSARRPDFGYGQGELRVGWMLNDPTGSGPLRGNFEFLIGGFGSLIFEGPGDYIVGADLNLRYNFVQPDAKVVPFFQIGAGGAYSDAAQDDPVQNLLGSDWSWELQSALGLRFLITDHLAFTIMAQYQHLSNAGTNDRNRGYNAIGGLAGLSWFF